MHDPVHNGLTGRARARALHFALSYGPQQQPGLWATANRQQRRGALRNSRKKWRRRRGRAARATPALAAWAPRIRIPQSDQNGPNRPISVIIQWRGANADLGYCHARGANRELNSGGCVDFGPLDDGADWPSNVRAGLCQFARPTAQRQLPAPI